MMLNLLVKDMKKGMERGKNILSSNNNNKKNQQQDCSG